MTRSPGDTAPPEGPLPSATGTFTLFVLWLFLWIQREMFIMHSCTSSALPLLKSPQTLPFIQGCLSYKASWKTTDHI